MSDSYPCPCCGHRVLDAMPGSHEICPVCFWEDDDEVQFRRPTMGGGEPSSTSWPGPRRVATVEP